ncbi:MAG: hypothetical protein HY931_00220 [Candidatus Falkowbacteria bacterium]|nr:MAG: hypothetical protein HY931_00220 [Candidatus Falkowbacteria bacterium]
MEQENINSPVNAEQTVNSGSTFDKEESIPPQAQKIMMTFFRFIMGRIKSVLLIPIILLVSALIKNRDSFFSVESLSFLVPLIFLIVFYFRSGNKFLDDFEKGMKSVRFDPAEYKTVRIGFKKKGQDVNLKK